jgi:hypothetical protein
MGQFQRKSTFGVVFDQKSISKLYELGSTDWAPLGASLTDSQIWTSYDEQIVASRTIAQQAEEQIFALTYQPSEYLSSIWQIQGSAPAEVIQYGPPAHLPLIWQIQGPDAGQSDIEILEQRASGAALETEATTTAIDGFDECPNPASLRANSAPKEAIFVCTFPSMFECGTAPILSRTTKLPVSAGMTYSITGVEQSTWVNGAEDGLEPLVAICFEPEGIAQSGIYSQAYSSTEGQLIPGSVGAGAIQHAPPAHLSLIWQIQGPNVDQNDVEILERRAFNAALEAEVTTISTGGFDECPNPVSLRANSISQEVFFTCRFPTTFEVGTSPVLSLITEMPVTEQGFEFFLI